MEYLKKIMELIEKTEFSEGINVSYGYERGMELLVAKFLEKRKRGASVFFIGNGGSSAIAEHMTADYLKNGGLKTRGLYDAPVLTCLANDYGYENVFSKQLTMLMEKGDLLVAVSSSGSSKNILNAIKAAKEKGGEVITFTGFDADNEARMEGDMNVYVPSYKYGMVESIHNLILQQAVDELMEVGENR